MEPSQRSLHRFLVLQQPTRPDSPWTYLDPTHRGLNSSRLTVDSSHPDSPWIFSTHPDLPWIFSTRPDSPRTHLIPTHRGYNASRLTVDTRSSSRLTVDAHTQHSSSDADSSAYLALVVSLCRTDCRTITSTSGLRGEYCGVPRIKYQRQTDGAEMSLPY